MFKFRLDWWLVLPPFLLTIFGLTILRSVVPDLITYQISFAIVAIIAFLLFAFTDYRIIFSLNLPIYILSILFLATPFIFGIISRGAFRWIQFGQISIQPSEIIKPFLLITFAHLATHRKTTQSIILFLIPALVIFFQPDLGTTLVLAVGWLTIFVSRTSFRLVLIGLLVAALLLPASWYFLQNYQKDRLLTFVNPYSDPLGKGYHVIQSIIAVGSGGFAGKGLGHGSQSQLRFLPERHTDFIFASLAEELGFIGGLFIIILLTLLLHRIFLISKRAPDTDASLFSLAILSMLTFQIFINIGMNMGLSPITGITLPFLSSGGSSLVSLAITLGILNSISTHISDNSIFQIH